MDALLGFQIPVGIGAVDLESHRLDARLVPVQEVQHFQIEALALRPSGVHAVEHAAPVAALCAACARVELQDGIVGIVLAGEQGADAQLLELRDELVQFAADVGNQGGVVLLVSHLDEGQDVLILAGELVAALHGAL